MALPSRLHTRWEFHPNKPRGPPPHRPGPPGGAPAPGGPPANHPRQWPPPPHFPPDGHSIAYSRVVAPPNVQDPPEWKYYSAIFIVGLDGSDPRQVTSTPKRHKGQLATETTDPSFSPTGKMLTFVRYDHP